MNFLIAQGPVSDTLGKSVDAATSLLSGRSDAMLILAIGAALVGLWIWKVVIPERSSKQENAAKQLEIQQKQGEIIAELSKVTSATHTTANDMHMRVKVMFAVSSVQTEILRKLTEGKLPVGEELAQIKGMYHLIERDSI